MTEVYRSRDHRWSVYRSVDAYYVYDEHRPEDDREVWSCATLAQLYEWMDQQGLRLADFDEVS